MVPLISRQRIKDSGASYKIVSQNELSVVFLHHVSCRPQQTEESMAIWKLEILSKVKVIPRIYEEL